MKSYGLGGDRTKLEGKGVFSARLASAGFGNLDRASTGNEERGNVIVSSRIRCQLADIPIWLLVWRRLAGNGDVKTIAPTC